MSDIDEDSDFEDIKKRGKRREMSDIDEDMMKTSRRERGEVSDMMKIVTLKTSRRGERGEK